MKTNTTTPVTETTKPAATVKVSTRIKAGRGSKGAYV